MALDPTLVRAYQNGEVSAGGFNATPTLPTDATTALNASLYTGTGILTDDGITESSKQDYQKIYGWQGGQLIANLPGTFEKSFKFAATQQSLFNLGLHLPGSTITQTAYGVAIAEKAPVVDKRVWVIHGISAGGILQRIVCPSGQITDRGDVVWSFKDITVYEWTVDLFADSSSNYTYRYIVDPTMSL